MGMCGSKGETKSKPAAAAPAEPAKKVETPFNFASGLPDCCTSNPGNYKAVCELPGWRMVEMNMKPGDEDTLHDHPSHNMYFVVGGKLSIRDFKDGKLGEPHEVAPPAGMSPIFPPGAHQVKNVGDNDVKCVFIEAYASKKPCGPIDGYISPFDVAPECYKVLAENDDFITGMLTMEPGQGDPFHHHKDHMIYMLEGDEVTIFPGGDEAAGMKVPVEAGHAVPAPMSAPPFFSHKLKNTGSKTLKLLFFEAKK